MYKKTIGKKDLEHHLLTKFISNECLGLRIKSITATETPDFIIHELSKTISIELTRLIHPKLIKAEAFQEKLVESVHKRFKENYSANLRVLVNFSKVPIKCKEREVSKYVQELYELVENIYLPNHKYNFNISSKNNSKSLNHFIDFISVSNNSNFENWQPFGAFRVDEINFDWLTKVIIEKEKNIIKYKTLSNENWLLLLANFGHKSSAHTFNSIQIDKLVTKFDKVYLYKDMDNTILQIK